MKTMKEVKRPASTEVVVDYIKCELCDRKAKPNNFNNWSINDHDVDESDANVKGAVNLQVVKGVSYPEGGHRNYTILDICPDCFRKKLIPWFESQGGAVRYDETDW